MHDLDRALLPKPNLTKAAAFYLNITGPDPDAKLADYAPPAAGGAEATLVGGFLAPLPEVLSALGSMIENELKTALAYRVYAASVRGLGRDSLADEFMEHALQETEHADWLMARAATLGGPVTLPDIPPPPGSTDPLDIVQTMLRIEQEGVAKWRLLHSMIEDGNPMKFKVEEYMAREQDHQDDLTRYLPETPNAELGAGAPAPAPAPVPAPTDPELAKVGGWVKSAKDKNPDRPFLPTFIGGAMGAGAAAAAGKNQAIGALVGGGLGYGAYETWRHKKASVGAWVKNAEPLPSPTDNELPPDQMDAAAAQELQMQVAQMQQQEAAALQAEEQNAAAHFQAQAQEQQMQLEQLQAELSQTQAQAEQLQATVEQQTQLAQQQQSAVVQAQGMATQAMQEQLQAMGEANNSRQQATQVLAATDRWKEQVRQAVDTPPVDPQQQAQAQMQQGQPPGTPMPTEPEAPAPPATPEAPAAPEVKAAGISEQATAFRRGFESGAMRVIKPLIEQAKNRPGGPLLPAAGVIAGLTWGATSGRSPEALEDARANTSKKLQEFESGGGTFAQTMRLMQARIGEAQQEARTNHRGASVLMGAGLGASLGAGLGAGASHAKRIAGLLKGKH